jgi:hypothetical protein
MEKFYKFLDLEWFGNVTCTKQTNTGRSMCCVTVTTEVDRKNKNVANLISMMSNVSLFGASPL